MTSYDKHLKYIKNIYSKLNHLTLEKQIRSTITELMFYLDQNHLTDKYYLEHNVLFLSCEVNQEQIKDLPAEILLSFLTMIYRIDYIESNSDAFMIYYKNKMLENILYHLIEKIEIIKGA